MMGGSNTRNM